jgi:Domain of unknown function (DU1801).
MSQSNKTRQTDESVTAFIDSVADEGRRDDARRLLSIMEEVTGYPARMWGSSIVGFGSYHYRYESGHEGDAPLVGFSPRKTEISIYLASDFEGRETLLNGLGKHRTGKACIYTKRLKDVDETALRQMIAASVQSTLERYPGGQ